ncbi:MAG: DUF429 domain-containing protein [Bauldia sp.]|nr:DUF429 domain-containing protein [Bauldia sp.]MCW5716891.1 DUF429 domain-containing protein [Bauldia sp.]
MDAAWTEHNPSGVALVAARDGNWRLLAAASSYSSYLGIDPSDTRSLGGPADVPSLVRRTQELAGGGPDIIAIDMPLASVPITSRRAADNAVSAAFGAAGCGTHSPSPTRPGAVAANLMSSLVRQGWPLATSSITTPATIEVYPHPALLALTGAARRLPYKAAKTRAYWPSGDRAERRRMLGRTWATIVEALDREIDGVAASFPLPDAEVPLRRLKAFEDTLDAVVCAWVGLRALAGRASPYGAESAAIWIPSGDGPRRSTARGRGQLGERAA